MKIQASKLQEEMLNHINNYRVSKLSQMEYCRKYKLSYCRLTYWIHKSKTMQIERALPNKSSASSVAA